MSSVKVSEGLQPVRAGSPARAVVCACGVDTNYLRAGRGEALVFIASDIEAPDAGAMIDALAVQYRVIAAAPPAGCAFDSWLPSFLEGLGVTDAHVLLHSSISTSILGNPS